MQSVINLKTAIARCKAGAGGSKESRKLITHFYKWQGNKDSNLGMLESKSSALTNLAIPLHNLQLCRINYARLILYYRSQSAKGCLLKARTFHARQPAGT